MATSKEYLDYILYSLSDLDDITYKEANGGYEIYYQNVLVGGVYDDQLLVKNTKAAQDYLVRVILQTPYENGEEMIMVNEVDDTMFLQGLIEEIYNDLSE